LNFCLKKYLSNLKTQTCPYCHSSIKPGADIIECPACETPHHKECWEENKGCTTYGCIENPEVKKQREENLDIANEVPPVVIPSVQPVQPINDVQNIPGSEIPGFEGMIPCPECGQLIDANSSYCKFCGHNISLITSEEDRQKFNEEFEAAYKKRASFHKHRIIFLFASIFLLLILFIYGAYKVFNYFDRTITSDEHAIHKTIDNWESAWENENLNEYSKYLTNDYGYYGSDNKKIDKETRLKRIDYTFDRYNFININIDSLKYQKINNEPVEYKVNFYEKYNSDKFKSDGQKTLYMRKENDEWKIYREEFK
jgi:hypothetical protein